jgi:hypothetical protein
MILTSQLLLLRGLAADAGCLFAPLEHLRAMLDVKVLDYRL